MHVKTYGRVTVRAVKVFRDAELAERWLKAPSRMLQGQTPLQALETDEGAAKVERQLNWFAGLYSRRNDIARA